MKDKTNNSPKNIPFLKVFLGHFDLFLKANKNAFILCFLFAGLETLLFWLSGNTAMCTNSTYRENYFCTNSVAVFVIIHSIAIFIECMFARNWLEIAILKKPFAIKNILIPNKKDLKILMLFLAYIATLGIAGTSFYLLYIRIPSPDWRIEMAYFAIVSIGFLAPLLALRFCAYIGAAACGDKLPAFVDVWQKTKGNAAKIFGALIILLMLGAFVLMQVSYFAMRAGEVSSLIQSVVIEYISDLLKMIIIALVSNFCYIQYDFLFKGEKDD